MAKERGTRRWVTMDVETRGASSSEVDGECLQALTGELETHLAAARTADHAEFQAAHEV